MEIKPIERLSLPDKIIEKIKDIIINGKLKPGDKLPPERELSEKFCVGRTTIREALKALSYAKIITRTREGTIINNTINFFIDRLNQRLILKQIDLADLMEMRKLLEVETVALTSRRATMEDIGMIEEILKEMNKKANQNVHAFISADIRFHEAIAEAAQNRVLYEIFITVRLLLREAQEEVIKYPGIIGRSLKYHHQIFEAVKKQNVSKAKSAMFDHLDDVEKALVSLGMLEFRKF